MKNIAIIILLNFVWFATPARTIVDKQLPLNNITVDIKDETLTLNIDFDFNSLTKNSNTEYIITPVIKSTEGNDSVEFAPFILTGHNLYYRHLRRGDVPSERMYNANDTKSLEYSNSVDLQSWMDDADILVRTVRIGCCNKPKRSYDEPVARVRRPYYTPKFDYVQPATNAVKEYTIEGSAYVNFPVNRTEIYPDYMNNPAELKRITGTIDSVKNDPDVTITYIGIKGFASPEGSYANNERLARGRTATLKDYVERISNLPHGFIKTSYMPEDWPGLRDYVAGSTMPNRDAILSIIDSDLSPDAKDAKIKRDFPSDYKMLLTYVYPSLRHSDYAVRYNVRSYTSVEEIMKVFHSQPQKLSAEEFYRAANSLAIGSEEHNEVYETAVRMFPENDILNLNAANNAMRAGRYSAAAKYLDKAGDSPSAIYARGIFAALQKDYPKAEEYFKAAAEKGQPNAKEALQQIQLIEKYADGNVEIVEE